MELIGGKIFREPGFPWLFTLKRNIFHTVACGNFSGCLRLISKCPWDELSNAISICLQKKKEKKSHTHAHWADYTMAIQLINY